MTESISIKEAKLIPYNFPHSKSDVRECAPDPMPERLTAQIKISDDFDEPDEEMMKLIYGDE